MQGDITKVKLTPGPSSRISAQICSPALSSITNGGLACVGGGGDAGDCDDDGLAGAGCVHEGLCFLRAPPVRLVRGCMRLG